MVFWKIYLNGEDKTLSMRQFINTMSIKYELSKPTTGKVSIQSNAYLGGLFTEGQKIKIFMGYYPHELIEMIDSTIIKTPDGSASDFISYTIDIADKVVDLSTNTKIINYKNPKKAAIISEIIMRNGYTPYIDIDDKGVIPSNETPIQNNLTDMQFLTQCATKWRCSWWSDQTTRTIYFVDYKKAHELGSRLKMSNINDQKTEYLLGYRTNNQLNNIAKLDWKIKPAQGTPISAETNVKKFIDEGIFEYYDTTWKLNPETLEQLKRNPSKEWAKIIVDINSQKTNEAELKTIKKYFIQYPAVQSNNNQQNIASLNSIGVEITCELNEADFYLRPPRSALLKAGTPKTKNSYLPTYIVSDIQRLYKINMVETSLAGGFAKTSLMAVPA